MTTKTLLFVVEKWCDGNPNLGFTNTFHNVLNTFSKCCNDFNWNVLHTDEASLIYKTHIDNILLNYCNNYSVDVICFSFLGQSPVNPTLNCLRQLKEMGIKLIFTWPDSHPKDLEFINELGDISDLNIYQDAPWSPFHLDKLNRPNDLVLWTPIDSRLFYPKGEKNVDVLSIGRRYELRENYLSFVKQRFPQMVTTGGQRERGLTPEEYAQYMQNSKIVINFSHHPFGYHQLKGRVLEAMFCKTLVMELENEATKRFFEPNLEYVPFSSPEELCEKIHFYLNNDKQRLEITNRAFESCSSKFNEQIYWNRILTAIGYA